METQPENISIGELSRRSGLPVKTIRYYSDVGVLPPAARTRSGYRRYGQADLVRLDLVRTLRELGVDLAAIRRAVRGRGVSGGECGGGTGGDRGGGRGSLPAPPGVAAGRRCLGRHAGGAAWPR